MEGMARIFQTKLEDNSSSKTVYVSDSSQMIQRIELLPNSIKLEGTKNYLSWSRRTLLNLRVK
jgi:hypothetical protein